MPLHGHADANSSLIFILSQKTSSSRRHVRAMFQALRCHCEALAELALDGKSRFDLSAFRSHDSRK